MTAMDLINGSKRALGRGASMAVSAATEGSYARKVVSQTMQSTWKANRGQLLSHAAIGAGSAIGVGMTTSAFSGRGYSGQDFIRQGVLGAAIGGGGTFAFHATRLPNMTNFRNFQSFQRLNGRGGLGSSMIAGARRMGGF